MHQAPAPTPKTTIGVDVRLPVPGEQEVTNFAINNGTLIAVVVVAAVVAKLSGFILRSWPVRIVLTVVATVTATVFLMNRGVG